MQPTTTPHPSDWIYTRWLGWYEYDEDGEKLPVMCAVQKTSFGYHVFVLGREVDHIKWFDSREDALEFAVDAQRELAAEHEISQCERD